ncbi:hypothetical protein GGR56DRAFT_362070 [Xylariaceae sp. FL0804]|nr:hypothetical protein GGR56DRAFT_362070 [Xylariaceae sp. FL0804]
MNLSIYTHLSEITVCTDTAAETSTDLPRDGTQACGMSEGAELFRETQRLRERAGGVPKTGTWAPVRRGTTASLTSSQAAAPRPLPRLSLLSSSLPFSDTPRGVVYGCGSSARVHDHQGGSRLRFVCLRPPCCLDPAVRVSLGMSCHQFAGTREASWAIACIFSHGSPLPPQIPEQGSSQPASTASALSQKRSACMHTYVCSQPSLCPVPFELSWSELNGRDGITRRLHASTGRVWYGYPE